MAEYNFLAKLATAEWENDKKRKTAGSDKKGRLWIPASPSVGGGNDKKGQLWFPSLSLSLAGGG